MISALDPFGVSTSFLFFEILGFSLTLEILGFSSFEILGFSLSDEIPAFLDFELAPADFLGGTLSTTLYATNSVSPGLQHGIFE